MCSQQNRDREGAGPKTIPLSYFITLTCYGTWLHGDERGSVDFEQNKYGTPLKPKNIRFEQKSRDDMEQEPYQMDSSRRDVIKDTILEVCDHRGWLPVSIHVRPKHLHIVLHSRRDPERIWNDMKSYGSRRLNEAGYDRDHRKRWARRGSGKYLWNTDQVQAAVRHTLHDQGKPMEWFLHPELADHDFREYDHQISNSLREFFQRHGVMDVYGNIVQSEE